MLTSGQRLLWLDATAGVTTSGGAVSNWADQSGNANNATQGTASAQPTHTASGGPNGRPYVSNSNAAADTLIVADAASLKPTSLSIWIVIKRNESNQFRTPLMKCSTSGWSDGYGIHNGATPGNTFNFFVNHFNSGGKASAAWQASEWATWHCRYDAAIAGGNQVLVDKNNGQIVANNVGSYQTAISHTTTTLGLLNQPGQVFYAGVDVSEIVICPALPAEEVAKMWLYFKRKHATF